MDGISERLDDARALFALGRKTGALLMILIAVAATARKRYPRAKFKDREAVTKFVRGEIRPLQDVLYEFMRCMLVHEASMPEDILFEPGSQFSLTVESDKIIFTDGVLDCLGRIVEQAPENT